MVKYTKNVNEPWFTLIKLGIKKCEGRLIKGDFAKIKKGDSIVFFNNEMGFMRSFRVKIIDIKYYNTFYEYLNSEKLNNCLPGIDTIEDGVNVYYKYYSKENEQKYKIIAIHIRASSKQY
jgi:ASC-1-like (ASCH) protein